MRTLKEVFDDDFEQPTNGIEYLCCYCDGKFERFEQPLFLDGLRASHSLCDRRALYSAHVTITD